MGRLYTICDWGPCQAPLLDFPRGARSGIRGFACCNELYEHLPVVAGFRALRSIGYDAVEVAPYTFGNSVGLGSCARMGHPRFRLNLDTGVLTDEGRPPAETIRERAAEAPDALAHMQVNDPNRLGPGMGTLDFAPIRDALADARYAGWLSVEAFASLLRGFSLPLGWRGLELAPAEALAGTTMGTTRHA
jgi:sugar phosphate isomerase/epimerase